MIKRFPAFFLLFLTSLTYGQLSDLAKIEYTYIPKGNANVGYDRIRGVFNYPIKFSKDNFLFIGLDYSNIDINFESSINAFDTRALDGFQLLDIPIGYTFKINDDWRFGARITPGFSSNFVRSISFEDVVFSGDIVLIKDKKEGLSVSKPYRLIIGVSYSENRGVPYPIPFISYYRKFHSKWSYNIGIPKSNLQYHISEKSRIKVVAELDGFTANIQNGILVNQDDIAETINMSIIVSGLRYEYKLMKHLELYLNFGNIIYSSAKLRNSKKNEVISVNKKNTLYVRTGVRFKI